MDRVFLKVANVADALAMLVSVNQQSLELTRLYEQEAADASEQGVFVADGYDSNHIEVIKDVTMLGYFVEGSGFVLVISFINVDDLVLKEFLPGADGLVQLYFDFLSVMPYPDHVEQYLAELRELSLIG